MRAGVCSYDEDTNGNPVVEQTAIRALLPVAWAKRYLPVKGLEQLYKEMRPVWTREEPSWLTDRAKERIRGAFGDVIDAAAARDDAKTDATPAGEA